MDATVRAEIDDEVRRFLNECDVGDAHDAPRQASPGAADAAVALVARVAAHAKAKGVVVEHAHVAADHAIRLSVHGIAFCTVSAAHGAIYVDPPARVLPTNRVPLVFDEVIEAFVAHDVSAPLDAVACIEARIARVLRETFAAAAAA